MKFTTLLRELAALRNLGCLCGSLPPAERGDCAVCHKHRKLREKLLDEGVTDQKVEGGL